MKCSIFSFFFFSLTSLSSLAQTDERFTIHWAINPSPPFHVVDGPLKGQGICDVLIDELKQYMPEVNHTVVQLPHSRIRMHSEQKQNLCFPCMIKRESSPVWVYSNITVVHPPLGIIGNRKRLAPFVDEKARISLAKLAADPQLRFGRPAARAYPPALQRVVDEYADNPFFFKLSGQTATVRILEQIVMNRLDYTLEYPTILRYYRLSQPSRGLQYFPTTELGNNPVPGAIGCTKNAWGARAVSLINSALDDVLIDEDYVNQQAFWQRIDDNPGALVKDGEPPNNTP
ncbi:hypothetical protein [Alteromonas sp. H39]|uniref:hypothetical protein n=1 Tax=Alteromonas sp. H39 TaxID=3389876 RepID=UPI0039E09AF7